MLITEVLNTRYNDKGTVFIETTGNTAREMFSIKG